MSLKALESRIRQMQKDLDRLTVDKSTFSGGDILKVSKKLDDLIVEYTKAMISN
ncbi:MAG: aspartyl-phosphate phosphatase Spo0E family protein [Caldicoprobacterales bacterium]|jgi:hypothetical protein|nr:Spo0E family sporulation regulatory protein-aspartic acid phosphatase [Clostridiales bacterium]